MLLAVAACGSDKREQPNDGREVRYHCDPAAAPADEAPLRRLTRVQLVNTVDRLVEEFAPSSATAIESALAEPIDRMPNDTLIGTRHGGLSRLDQALQQQLNDATYFLAVAVGKELTSSRARITEVVGACATDSSTTNDATCLADFIKRFGAKAFRQPLNDDEVASFTAAAEDGPVAATSLARVIGLVLASPQFFYHMEYGQPDGPESGLVPLSAYELAARLSYHFWDQPPDDELWEAAANGSLLDDAVYAAQVNRVVLDPRTASALGQFFREWLELDLVPTLDGRIGEPLFDAFAGDDVPDAELRDAIIADVVAATQYELSHGGSFTSLLRNTKSFAQHDGLAKLYGVPRWDGTSEPPQMPEGRTGLLTRAAFLVTGSANTRPVRKGIFIRSALMCDTVPSPPADADLTPPVATADSTVRESLEERTEAPGTVCAGCHTPFINHLGYATESFDALGRMRAHETLFDDNAMPIREVAVNTVSIPQVIPGDTTESRGAGDLTDLIDKSGKAHSCIARDYFRFAFERLEDETRDGCTLAALEEQAQLDRPLIDVFSSVALQSNFRMKRFQ
ncbi:MAG: DUF1592 domain-containing protein [Kofleriaceae bacterium]|nr:DUF1592 domain-containing protein [Kofleriaceae bacterium]